MTATLRVVLDQLVSPTQADLAEASRELTAALVGTAPRGADVAAILPRGEASEPSGLADVTRLALPRRELAASWQLGVAPGVGKGMIHSPTLLAPLIRHDRVHETHQIVVTLWDLNAWDAPAAVPRAEALWQRAMLKRAEKHADAVVVPAHALAARLAEISPRLAGRIRVIAGAPPAGFRVPTDAAGRLRTLTLAPGAVVVVPGSGRAGGLASALRALSGTAREIVVLGVAPDEEPLLRDEAEAAGIPAARLRMLGSLDAFDRAAVLSSAALVLCPSTAPAWPWRTVEALAVGTPVVAADSAVHREVLADAAVFADADGLADAVGRVLGAEAGRYRVLAEDRGKGFAWREAAERVWQLHAEL